MISGREAISAAAFALLKGIDQNVGVQTFSRRFVSTADLGSAQLPAVFFLVKGERAEMPGRGLPVRWLLDAEIWTFIATNDVDAEPETTLNGVLDAIETAIAPDKSTGRQTLSGLVYDFRINGTIVREQGFTSGVGAALIPIEIRTTS